MPHPADIASCNLISHNKVAPQRIINLWYGNLEEAKEAELKGLPLDDDLESWEQCWNHCLLDEMALEIYRISVWLQIRFFKF